MCWIVDQTPITGSLFFMGSKNVYVLQLSGTCDREGDIDWYMSYTVTVRSLNPTQSNPMLGPLHLVPNMYQRS